MTVRSTDRPEHRPVRTCVGCRATAPQSELVRVAVVAGRTVADPRRRAPGRGAYVHPRPACVTAAAKGGLARTLRRSVSRAEVEAIGREIASGGFSSGPDGARPADRPDGVGPSQTLADAVESGPRPVASFEPRK